ncbi:retention module-containing protein [Congregibacter litoralis]|uniref:Putative Ig domain protein n=1 Tax=Congregibacter litoralis KT71 TaxID=314285 RepID=A4A585_9GAMM|nr:retention module-containing protein [Congregibacter litoralis]EAQ98956.2 putative Ig domain protein [Congregibacter litoralis KT71]
MAQAIGTVDIREGKVFARSNDGSLRELKSGDAVFQGEVLVPSADAVVELLMPDMPSIALVADTEMLLSSELLNDTATTASEAALEDSTIAAVVAALEGDGDILDNLEAPAAGGGRGDEGSSFVRLGRIGFDLPEFEGFRAALNPETLRVVEAEADNDLQLLLDDDPDGPTPPVVQPPAANAAPDAADDTFETPFGGVLVANVLSNDTDPEGAVLRVADNGEPANGTVTVDDDGVFSYTPNDGFSGSDSFTYTITDPDGGTDTATVFITVTPEVAPPPAPNLAPDAVDDVFEVGFESALVGSVLGNDSDPEGDSLTVTGNTDPDNGTVSVEADGSFIYSPNDDFSGSDSFTYTITDANGNTDTATVLISVGEETVAPPPPPAPNVGPDAINDTATVEEDTPLTITVLTNDADPDGDPLTVTAITQPANGTAVLNADGTVTYTPNADYNGPDSFTYTISDGQGGTDTATVNLTVTPVDDAPVSADLGAQANLDADSVSLDVSGNFSDVDSALTYSATGLPAGLSIDPSTGVISGTIDNSASQTGGGVYSVVVSATDGVNSPVSESFEWTVTNPGPDAVDDTQGAAEDTEVDISVLANDTDVDGDTLSILSFTQPDNGTVTDNGDGTLRYTPDANYNGPDSFTYTITDSEGGTDTATVNLNVDAANDPPVSIDLAAQSSEDADSVSLDVSGNFNDVDSTLTYSATGLPAGLSINPSTGVISGTIDNSASQVGGGVYNVTVTATDGVNPPVSESFDWTVTNPGPTASDDAGTTDEDTAVTFAAADLLGNDNDPDGDDLTIASVGSPSNGTVVLNGDGTATFTPDADYNGAASFEYTISDGEGGVDTATVNLTVNAVNDPPVVINPLGNQSNDDADVITPLDASTAFEDVDSTLTYSATGLPDGLSIDPSTGIISGTIDNSASQVDGGVYNVTVTATDGVNPPVSESFDWTVTNPGPTASDDAGTTDEDTAVTFAAADLLGNDNDPDGDDLTIASVGSPTNGTVVLNGDGTVTFTPDADYNGAASFEYTISDGEGGVDTATVNLTVNAVNDPPVVINPLAPQTNDDADVITPLDASTAFEDVDSTLTYSATGLPDGLSIDPSTGIISGTIDNSASQVDGGVYNVTVTATDGVNPPVSESFDWTVTNPGPTASDDAGTTDEDTAVTFAAAGLLGNDNDPDADDLTITSVGSPTNGTVVLNGDGTVTFTPDADYNGPASFEYTISDGEGGTDTATVSLTVNAVNDPPVVINPLAPQTNDDADVITPVEASAAFADVDSTLTYSATGLPTGLTINASTGAISGTIDNSASQVAGGVYNVTVTATDGVNPSVSESFDWKVTNPGPEANDDSETLGEDSGATVIDVLANDSDPDGDDLTVTSVGTASNGTVSLVNGVVSYTPNENYNGPDSFTYTISDGEGGTATATVNLTVDAANDPPVSVDLNPQNNADADVVSLDLSGNFSDVDSILEYSATGLPAGLTIDSATGIISGTIDNSASQVGGGVYNVTVTATDGVNPSVSESFDWTVTNPGPTAADDAGTTDEDTAVMFTAANLLANDSDPDADDLTITSVGSPINGTVVLNGDGTVTFTPDADYNGSASFEYTISDGEGGTDTATVNLTVNAVNDPPVVINPLGNQSNDDAEVITAIDASSAFEDVDSTLEYSATGLPDGLTIDPNTGIISGTIDNSASQVGGGVYNVTVTATDGVNPPVSESFDWTVTNPGPTAADDTGSTDEDVAVTFTPADLLGNDTDPDADDLTITSVGSPSNGTVVLNGDGSVTFTPDADYNGPASFEYTISDGESGTDTATVSLTVNAVDDPPVVINPLGNQSNDDADVIAPVDASAAFADIDSTLTYSATGLPTGLTINASTGVISGTIDNSASQLGGGVYNVTVTATDGVNPPVSESFDWTVTNPGPTAADDTGSTDEDVAVTFTPAELLGNDIDPDADDLTITSVGSPSNGTVVLNGDGTVTFTPDADYNGPASFEYTISDGEGGTDTATVSLTVNAVNDPPVVINPLAPQTNDDADVITPVDASAAFADVDSTLTYSATGLPTGLTINASTGIISGTIDNSASQVAGGVYNVTVTATDGVNPPVSESFDWTVTNPGPTAADDAGTTDEDTAVTFTSGDLLGNDSDPDGDDLTITSVGSPSNGTVVLNGDGTVTFTPDADYNGPASFEYTVSDGEGGTDTATVNLTVNPVNDPPVVIVPLAPQANDDADVITPLDTSTAFEDVDSTLTYSATGLPTGLTIDPSTGVISGTVDNSASQVGGGVYNVTVTATDGVNTPVSESFDWTVTNPGPVANDDSETLGEDSGATVIDVLANDSDPDGDDLTVTSVGTASNGTVSLVNGVVSYTPNADYNGPDSFTYTISDGEGGTATATVNLTVDAANDPPVSVDLNPQNNADADVVSLDLSGNFSDVDSSLEYSATGLPTGLTIDSATGIISGTIDNSASQVGGGVYSVTVTATDGVNPPVSESFDWTVTNPGPTAADDTGTTDEDAAVTFAAADLLGNDNDPDADDLTITSVGSPSNGTVVLNGDGTVTFTPDADYNGPASFEYTISDGEGGTDTATVSLTVNAVNDPPVVINPLAPQTNDDADVITPVDASAAFADVDSTLTYSATGLPDGLIIDPNTGIISGTIDNSASQLDGGVYNVTVTATDGVNPPVIESFDWTVTNPGPTASDDAGTTDEDTAVTFAAADLLGNDIDPDADDLTITSVGSPSNGTVVLNGDGTVTFTPDADYNGPASFEYTVSDGEGGTDAATVNLTVNPVNDPPVVIVPLAPQANDDADVITPLDTSTAFEDVDSTLTYSATGLPTGLTIDPSTGVISGTIDNSASQVGGGVYNVTVTATDGVNPPASESFDWTVANPGLTAADDTGSTDEDVAVTFTPAELLANDSDPDGDDLTITSVGSPSNGTVVLNGDGTVTFTPDADYNGSASFEYTVSDGEGGTDTATVNLTVDAVNDPPVSINPLAPQANDDADVIAPLDASAAFADVDSTLEYSATGLPNGLSIDPNTGIISGTIDNSASQVGGGVYNVTVTATDGVNAPISESFAWTVTNPGPVANDDSETLGEDTGATVIDVLANDSDSDGDDLTVTSVGTASNGTVSLANGVVSYTPNENYNGPDSFTYTISDGEGGTATATVNLTVDAANDPPISIDLNPQNNADADVVSLDLSGNFSDVDSTLTYSATGLPTGLTINASTGVISGTIDNSASQVGGGVYNVTVTATDGVNPPVSESFDWTVTNPGPTATDDSGSTNEDTSVTFDPADLLGNDNDPDGDDLTITSVGSPSNGTVVLNGDGSVTFTPDADYNGPASFEYTISDGEGGTDTATVNLTVTAVNDPPVVINPLSPQANDDADVIAPVDASAAFADVDSTLTYSATGLPAGLSIDPSSGIISGTLDNSASQVDGGVYNVIVTATDGVNPPVSESFDWTVTNPGPDAVDDSVTTVEDIAIDIDVLADNGNGADSDVDGDTLTISSFTQPTNGTVTDNGDGTLKYTPNPDYNGSDSFTYIISDGEGGTDTATVNLTVTPENDPPESDAKTLTVAEDTNDNAVPTLTGSDSDGSVSGFVITSLPANGTLLLSGVAVSMGQTVPAAEAGNLTYTPNADYFGDDSFSYASVDDNGAQDGTPANVAITVTEVAEPDTPPTADPLTALAEIANGPGPNGTLSNPQLEVFLSVDGIADGVGLEGIPTLGGVDDETPLENLVFTLRSPPTDGILYLDAEGDGSYEQAQVGDTFSSASSFYWAKPAEQVVQDLTTDATGVTVSGFNGRNATITQSRDGLGVDSAGNTQPQAPTQLGYRNGSSETMVLNLGGPATEATVQIERLFPNEGEAGRVEALDADGNVLGVWTFYGRANATLDGVPVDFNIGGSGGSFTLSDIGQPFYALRFTATPYVDGVTQGTGKNADSSDYLIKSVAYSPISLADAEFTYDVTDEQGNVSDPATVTIRQSNAPITLDLDNDGLEYLSREAGVVFTDEVTGESVNTAWVAPDDGLLVIDANESGTVDQTEEYVFTEWSENAETDMEAVAEVFDTNQNSQLDPGDESWEQFAVWQDADSDGVTDEGELRSLDELGVDSIALTYSEESTSGSTANGDVTIHGQSDVTWTDGSVSVAEDASFAISAADVLSDDGDLILPAHEGEDSSTIARDVPASEEQKAGGEADIAALEIDLLLNNSNDDKSGTGEID